eukprot:SAG31_NODE_2200_length_6208_cov_2.781306_1_plen_185_part_00
MASLLLTSPAYRCICRRCPPQLRQSLQSVPHSQKAGSSHSPSWAYRHVSAWEPSPLPPAQLFSLASSMYKPPMGGAARGRPGGRHVHPAWSHGSQAEPLGPLVVLAPAGPDCVARMRFCLVRMHFSLLVSLFGIAKAAAAARGEPQPVEMCELAKDSRDAMLGLAATICDRCRFGLRFGTLTYL